MKNQYTSQYPALLLAIAAVCFLCVATPASADLILAITGVPGSGSTTWAFSGSSTVTGTGTTGGGAQGIGWAGAPTLDYTSVNDKGLNGTSGSVTVSGTALDLGSFSTTYVYYDDDTGGSNAGDDIGIDGPNADGVAFSPGTISWSGVIIAPVDINVLSNTALPLVANDLVALSGTTAAQHDNSHSFTGSVLDFSITSVPEPSAFLFGGLVCGLVGLAQLRRQPNRGAGE